MLFILLTKVVTGKENKPKLNPKYLLIFLFTAIKLLKIFMLIGKKTFEDFIFCFKKIFITFPKHHCDPDVINETEFYISLHFLKIYNSMKKEHRT